MIYRQRDLMVSATYSEMMQKKVRLYIENMGKVIIVCESVYIFCIVLVMSL